MRLLARAGGGLATTAALLALMAGTTLAGNFAQVTFIDGSGPPTAGEEREIRFELLQHGVTPVDDGRVDLTLVNPGTGEEITVAATSLGDGMWTAAVTFPSVGAWQMGVTHEWFETSPPIGLEVGPSGAVAWLPAALAIGAFGAAALVVVGGMFLLRGRSIPVATPAEGAVRAHG